MADKYKGSFVSKSSIEAERNHRRSYLEQELERVSYFLGLVKLLASFNLI